MAVTLFPYVFQVRAGDKNQIIISNCFTVISHRSLHSRCIPDEIKLEFGMAMDRKVERRFVSVGQVEAVAV